MARSSGAGSRRQPAEVSDYGRSLAWYRDVPVRASSSLRTGAGAAPVAVDGLLVGIGQSEEVVQGGGATLTFTVRDIAAARGYLEGEGVRFDGDTRQVGEMVKLATFYDPTATRSCSPSSSTGTGRGEPAAGSAAHIVLLRRPAHAPDLPEASSAPAGRASREPRPLSATAAARRRRAVHRPGGRVAARPLPFPLQCRGGAAAMADDPSVRAGRLYADSSPGSLCRARCRSTERASSTAVRQKMPSCSLTTRNPRASAGASTCSRGA